MHSRKSWANCQKVEQKKKKVVVGLANFPCDFRRGDPVLPLELKSGTKPVLEELQHLWAFSSLSPYSRHLLFLLKVRLATSGEIIWKYLGNSLDSPLRSQSYKTLLHHAQHWLCLSRSVRAWVFFRLRSLDGNMITLTAGFLFPSLEDSVEGRRGRCDCIQLPWCLEAF